METITLTSSRPPSECEARLRGAIDDEGLFAMFKPKLFAGLVSGGTVRISRKGKSTLRLTGTLEASGTGTLFRGVLEKSDYSLRAFAIVAGVIWLIAMVIGVISYFTEPPRDPGALIVLPLLGLPIIGMIAVFAVLFRLTAEREKQLLIQLVSDALGGSPDVCSATVS